MAEAAVQSQAQETQTRRTRVSLKYSIFDGVAYSFMQAFSEMIFVPCAIFLGATNLQLSNLSSLPQLVASSCQMWSARMVEKHMRRKFFFVVGALMQAFSVGIVASALLFPYPACVWVLIFGVGAFLASLNFAVPPWQSLMGDLVPAASRGRYWGVRNFICGIGLMAAALLQGVFLDVMKTNNVLILGFAIAFGFAALCRVVSAVYLMLMHEPKMRPPTIVTEQEDFKLFKSLTVFIALVNFSMMVAGPYFGAYQLSVLHFNYTQYTISSMAHSLLLFGMMPAWGLLADEFGSRTVLLVCGPVVSLAPFLWSFSTEFSHALMSNAVAGFGWSGLNLATTNLIYESIPSHLRARRFAQFAVANAVAMFVGATIGGLVVDHLPTSFSIGAVTFSFISSFCTIFIVSGLLRTLTCILLIRKVSGMIPVKKVGLMLQSLMIETNPPALAFNFLFRPRKS